MSEIDYLLEETVELPYLESEAKQLVIFASGQAHSVLSTIISKTFDLPAIRHWLRIATCSARRATS
jgi:hypothetical protein